MNYRNIVIIIYLLLFVGSCKQETNNPVIEEISFKNFKPTSEKLFLSEFVEEVQYIQLETQEDCLIDKIVGIEMINGIFLVHQKGEILQFDLEGRFIKSLYEIGKGPGECFGRCFTYDCIKKQIYVYDNFKRQINVYGLDGSFIKYLKNSDCPNCFVQNILVHQDFLISGLLPEFSPEYFLLAYNYRDDVIKYKYENKYASGMNKMTKPKIVSNYNIHLQGFNKFVVFKEIFCDTVYQTTDFNNIAPRYIINLGQLKLTYAEHLNQNQKFISSYEKKIKIQRLLETNGYLFFLLKSRFINYLAVYEKKTGKMQVSESFFLKNDFNETMDFQVFGLLNTWYHEDYLLCIIQPGKIIEYMKTFNPSMSNSEFLTIATNINKFDNPVIMMIKLKS